MTRVRGLDINLFDKGGACPDQMQGLAGTTDGKGKMGFVTVLRPTEGFTYGNIYHDTLLIMYHQYSPVRKFGNRRSFQR